MFPLEILHDLLLHGFRLRERQRFVMLKGNFEWFIPALEEDFLTTSSKLQFE